jgi:hypothetical protein
MALLWVLGGEGNVPATLIQRAGWLSDRGGRLPGLRWSQVRRQQSEQVKHSGDHDGDCAVHQLESQDRRGMASMQLL